MERIRLRFISRTDNYKSAIKKFKPLARIVRMIAYNNLGLYISNLNEGIRGIMKENKASRTADLTAAIRARHKAHDSELIFDDEFASQLTSRVLSVIVKWKAVNWLINSRFGPDIKGAESLVLYRADYIERQLSSAIKEGCRQYVILAAGMDSFAYRCKENAGTIKVFEIDHPTTQRVKLNRINKYKIKPKIETEYIAIDLANKTLEEALAGSSYQKELPTFFSCAGLTYYLSEDQIFDLFESIASISAAGSQLVFDYSDDSAVMTEDEHNKRNQIRSMLKNSGEEIRSNFSAEHLPGTMAEYGYSLKEDWGPKEIHHHYFSKRTPDGLRVSPHNRIACYEIKA